MAENVAGLLNAYDYTALMVLCVENLELHLAMQLSMYINVYNQQISR